MFWRFGGYANISTIDTILDKNDFTLEELLDEGDLIQELKQHNAKLIDYLRDEPVLVKLLEYVVAPKLEPVATPDVEDDEEKEPEADTEKGKGRVLPFSRPRASSRASEPENKEEEMEKKRNRYAYVAAEILASDNWSICEALLANKTMLRNFWEFLQHPIPLDPLQASYFTKVNEALFDKKTEEMIEMLKSIDNAVPDMLRHVDCPMIMDLLLKIISLERTEAGQGIVEWLYTQDVMPALLSFLGPEHSWATQTSAGDFMKAIITVSANASQNEQTCIGPNELTRQLVSKDCVEKLIFYMLGGGNALTVGVGIVIEVIRKNNSDYDPDVGAEASSSPSSRDPIYLGTLLRLFAEHVPDFAHLIMNAPAQKARLDSTFGDKIEPLGFDRFKTCELMAELLHCSNMGLLNEVGSEELIAARDSERQRLRVEGKLSALRGEDVPSSADDLTMRISHSSPADEGRRLEITNISEDDGFEEVGHSKEMTEDTSHEFVKAEEEIQAGQATSFLDKDEDDFVDEPLSSPRLEVSDAKIEEPEFDDPDLVVAPLSPSKQKAVELNDQPPSPSKDEDAKVEDLVEDMQKSLLEDKPKTPEPQETEGSAEASGDSTPAIDTPAASSVAEAETTKPETEDAAPAEPEAPSSELQTEEADKPAPLFSQAQPAAEEDAVATEEPKAAEAAGDAEQGEQPESAPEAVAPEAVEPEQPEQGPAEASILVGHEVQPDAQDLSNVQPVVGDYLKMQFVEYGIVPTILSFFFKYPWNNFLHNVVYDIVQQVFNGPMDRGFNPTLAISLFESADVTSQIINGQQASEQSQQQNKTRMGYMGHLTLIAEEVVKFTERHPPELLSETVLQKVMDQEWINYVEGALAETRERDNAILGGVRPEVAMSNRQAGGLSAVGLSSLGAAFGSSQGGSSNALADAGLNGGLSDMGDNGGGNGIGPFAISSGTLMSGFGSSSDEDEDEEAENEEDVNNEGSEDCIEDSDSDSENAETPCRDLDDDHDHDSAEEDELEPRKTIQKRVAPAVTEGPRRGSLADLMDDFEDVSLHDESDADSLGHLSPNEWQDVEDPDMERMEDDLTGPVQQVDDGALELESDVVGQADDDGDPLFNLLITVNFPSEEEMQPRRALRDEEIYEDMRRLVRELFDGKYPSAFLNRMADILSCPPGRPPNEHDMRVQDCLVEIGRLVQNSPRQDQTAGSNFQMEKLVAEEDCGVKKQL
ncbi:sporulation-induced protein [Diaporthe australafricana]|uniref:Sporulation-induced protein n=1 Tax=Diaporthe australafricana TaxID=127596 RepID=A0ABR3WAG0_9PEZI